MKTMVVGDIHGDWGKLNALITKKQPDIVLQCGDFGWWPSFEVNKPVLYGRQVPWQLKGVKPGNAKLYWCDGNHEDHQKLEQDGLIHEMYPGVCHASRGSVLRLDDGRNVLFIGGADSVDKQERTIGHDWFPEENIDYRQFEMAMAVEDRVDIVVSHTCPGSFCIEGIDGKRMDSNRIALDRILERYRPSQWFFGHWHKHLTGVHGDTRWTCLDYPGHGGGWWQWLDG